MLSPTSRTFDPIPLSNSLAAIIIVDYKGNIQQCSNGFCEFINMVRTSIIDKPVTSIFTKTEQPVVRRLLSEVFSGLPSNASLTFIGTDKKTRIGNLTLTPLIDNNTISSAYCFIKNVGDQPDITKVRTDSEQRLKAIFENEPECVKITSPKGKIIDINPSGLTMVEAEDKAVVLGADVYQLIDEEDKQLFKSFHQNATRGISGRLEFRITGLKGTKRWMDSNMVALRNANEEVYAVLSVTRDVTERKKAEFLLANNERRFRSLVEMGSDLIGIVDAKGFYKYAGPSALSVLGYTPEDLIEKSAFDFIHPEDVPAVMHDLMRVNENSHVTFSPFRFINKKGEWRWIETKAIDKTNDPSICGIIVNSRDVTEKKASEEVNKYREQRFKALVHNGSDIMVILDEDANFLYLTENITRILGYTSEQLLAKNAFDFIHEEDLNNVIVEFQKVLKQDERALGVAHRFKNSNGDWAWLESKGVNHISDPLIGGIIVNAREINDRIKLQQKLDEELSRRQKMITAAAINAQEKERSQVGLELHDNVNQVLTTVKLYQELCLEGIGNQEELIRKSMGLLQDSINEIRSLSKRLSAPTLGNIKLTDSIKELLDAVSATGKISIAFNVCDGEYTKVSQELHLALYRILQEHLTNILKHAKANKVEVYLRTEKKRLVLQVTDDGIGFNPKKKSNGIGITNMTTRAESLKGTIKIISAPEQGCALIVQFPI